MSGTGGRDTVLVIPSNEHWCLVGWQVLLPNDPSSQGEAGDEFASDPLLALADVILASNIG